MNDYLMIATVLKPQGVRGECKLRSYAADIERFHKWDTLYLKKNDSFLPVSLRTVRIRDGFVYAHLDGSDSADAAEYAHTCQSHDKTCQNNTAHNGNNTFFKV